MAVVRGKEDSRFDCTSVRVSNGASPSVSICQFLNKLHDNLLIVADCRWPKGVVSRHGQDDKDKGQHREGRRQQPSRFCITLQKTSMEALSKGQ